LQHPQNAILQTAQGFPCSRSRSFKRLVKELEQECGVELNVCGDWEKVHLLAYSFLLIDNVNY
jgi:DNA topoisomerase VI subunit A